MECYHRFIALPKQGREKLETEEQNPQDTDFAPATRSTSRSFPKSSITTGVFPKVCIFCGRARKKVKGREQKLLNAKTQKFESGIRKYIQWKKDRSLETKLNGIHFAVKEVKYHSKCRLQYQCDAEAIHKKSTESAQKDSENYWHSVRECNSKAFDGLVFFLQDKIISGRQVLSLKSIAEQYHYLLLEYGAEFSDLRYSNPGKLGRKIKERFKSSVIVEKESAGRSVVYSASLLPAEARRKKRAHLESSDVESRVRSVALKLREEISMVEKSPLPKNVTSQDVCAGEAKVPKLLSTFFQYLIGGPDQRHWNHGSKNKRIESMCEDAIFCTTAGRVKPKKHLMMGIAVKSMTGSRNLVEMLNKLGHCASYHTLEEIETELTFESFRSAETTPFGMKCMPDHGTGVAWDNFDRYVETVSGKDTLHDTVGIAYQTVFPGDGEDLQSTSSNTSNFHETPTIGSRKRRRRVYEAVGVELTPYRKKPRMATCEFLKENDEKRKTYENANLTNLEGWKKDILWMSGFRSSSTPLMPMWSGWNTSVSAPEEKIQKIWYLPQINQSPTSNTVVAETMNRSLELAKEAGKNTIAVTYDLAIAKMAMQIQNEEAPKYNGVFVALGAFHIELSLLKALGKLVAESGGPYVLNECGILARGSLNSFYQGKNYKRCKRMHEILALSLESLHFQRFLSQFENEEELEHVVKIEISRMQENGDLEFAFSQEFLELLQLYATFSDKTSKGEHGKTAQFWMQYINFIHLYHVFVRATRIGDLDIYISTLPKIANCFFSLNHVNYARSITKYYDNLLKISDTHPEVYEDFKKGLFAIRRTHKPFSGIPIDLTLEQTINADSASQRHTRAMSNSVSARQRWAKSHYLRSVISSKLLTELGMSKADNVSRDLRTCNISSDNLKVRKVTDMIATMVNPFAEETDKDLLLNIATGKAVSAEAENFLLKFTESGEVKRQRFIQECIADPKRFDRPIPRNKVATFATEAAVKRSSGKYEAACLIRDIFGNLLHLALRQKIDMGTVLKYPLTPVPLALSHVDGTMQKTAKSSLTKHLELRVKSSPPNAIDVTIVDAMFFLHTYTNLPPTFSGVAKFLLRRICELEGNTIHFVSDKWIKPSIKDPERTFRSNSLPTFHIQGPAQIRPSNWIASLKNASFKKSLIDFLTSFWQNDYFAPILGYKILYANNGDTCFKYFVLDNKMHRREAPEYESTHEEADCRMFYHLSLIDEPSNVVVRRQTRTVW